MLHKGRDDGLAFSNSRLKKTTKVLLLLFQMQLHHPEAFQKKICAQTYHVANNFVIILNFAGPDIMHLILEIILTTDGVQAVLPCKLVHDNVKYKNLVYKHQKHAARTRFINELTNLING